MNKNTLTRRSIILVSELLFPGKSKENGIEETHRRNIGDVRSRNFGNLSGVAQITCCQENLMSLTKSIERLGIQAERQQLLLKYIESMAKEKSVIIRGVIEVIESTSQGPAMESTIEGGSMLMKGTKSKGTKSKGWMKKIETQENPSDRNKFKKLEMLVFSGNDLDSWLFRADWYFQIHKLTD